MEIKDRAYQLSRTFRRIDHGIWKTNSAILKETGLTRTEIDVMFTIYHYNKHNKEEVSASKIADLMEVTIAAVMHKLSDLENEGYIKRVSSKTDKRTKFVSITSKWLDIIKKLDKHEEDIIMNFLETLPKKGEHLERVLKDFLKYLEGVVEKND